MSDTSPSRDEPARPDLTGAAPDPLDLAGHGLPGWQLQALARGRVMPWLNGGGSTTELLRVPPQDEAAPFEWRVSVAQVGASGPFSAFPGVDRQLAILQGDGLRLHSPGLWPQGLTLHALAATGQDATPLLAFPGEAPIHAELAGGPLLDFNLMSWRGRWQARAHSVTALAGRHALELDPSGQVWQAWFALSDGLQLCAAQGAGQTPLAWPRHSLLWAGPGARPCAVNASSHAAWIALGVTLA